MVIVKSCELAESLFIMNHNDSDPRITATLKSTNNDI